LHCGGGLFSAQRKSIGDINLSHNSNQRSSGNPKSPKHTATISQTNDNKTITNNDNASQASNTTSSSLGSLRLPNIGIRALVIVLMLGIGSAGFLVVKSFLQIQESEGVKGGDPALLTLLIFFGIDLVTSHSFRPNTPSKVP